MKQLQQRAYAIEAPCIKEEAGTTTTTRKNELKKAYACAQVHALYCFLFERTHLGSSQSSKVFCIVAVTAADNAAEPTAQGYYNCFEKRSDIEGTSCQVNGATSIAPHYKYGIIRTEHMSRTSQELQCEDGMFIGIYDLLSSKWS